MNFLTKTGKAAILSVVVLLSNSGLPVLGDEDNKTLWNVLTNEYRTRDEKPGILSRLRAPKKTFESWCLVEGVPLVKAADGIPDGHAALASILQYMDFIHMFKTPMPGRRFSNGDNVITDAIFANLGLTGMDVRKREKLYEPYYTYISSLDTAADEDEKLSYGQQLAAKLKARSDDPELAVRSFLQDRFYRPVIRTEITPEMAKTYLDCQNPFVLIRKGKHHLCLGYIVKDSKLLLVVADCTAVRQDIRENADGSDNEKTEGSANPFLDFDWQSGKKVRDIMFMPAAYDGTGISFIEPALKEKAIVIGSLQPDQAKVNKFIKEHREYLDKILNSSDDQKKTP